MKNRIRNWLALLVLTGAVVRVRGDVAFLEWGPVAPVQVLNQPIAVTLSAVDATTNVVTNFNGSVTFSSSVALWPTNSGSFSNGVWSGTVFVRQTGTNLVLNASNGQGHTGQSDPFQVVPLSAGAPPARSGGCLSPPPGLVAWWRAEGNAADYVRTNDGALTGGVVFQPGAVGQAFSFDGETGGVTVPASSDLAVQSLTIEGWIYPTETSGPHPILCYSRSTGYAGIQLLCGDGSIQVSLRTAPTGPYTFDLSGGNVPAYHWTHVAVTYDYSGKVASLYVNGQWQMSDGGWASPIQLFTAEPVELGYLPAGTTETAAGARFAGLLDEFSIYNRALSAAEIQAIYNAGGDGKCSGSVPPAVMAQPADATNIAGTTASFSVVARGSAPLAYRWLKNGLVLGDGGNVAGATTANLTIEDVQDPDAAAYSVVLSNSAGVEASSPAKLMVLDQPVVLLPPASITNVTGSTATFTVGAYGGAPLSYQWQKDGTNLVDGGNLSGATSATLTLRNISEADAGSYRVVVSNAVGKATSPAADFRVIPSLVVAWGADNSGSTEVPVDLTNAVSVAAGAFHNLAVRSDGTVAAWGDDTYGQCDVPPGLTNAIAISAGWNHSVALRADGTVVAWGAGTNDTGSYPDYGQSLVPAGLSNVTAIVAGYRNTLALKSDGRVVEWGNNLYGQDNPPANLTNAIAIAGANDFSLALRADGTVVKWGASYTSPVNLGTVPAGLSNVVAISAGRFHSLALKSDGTLVAWGDNQYGEGVIPPGMSNVVAISAGSDYFNLAMKADGSVVAWGNGSDGETNIPVGVSYAVAISAGLFDGVAALMNNGVPTVLQQPQSQALAPGKTSTFTVLAVGAPGMTYQWQKDGVPLTDGGNVTGSATPNLTIQNVQNSDVAVYTAGITNIAGNTVSSPALLTTLVPLAINTQPVGLTNLAGTTARFTVYASGAPPLDYQWFKNGTPLTDRTNVSGAQSNILVLANISSGDAAGYSVVVSNLTDSVTSSVAQLTVVVPAPRIAFQSSNPNEFSLSFAGVPGVTYRIQYAENLANPNWLDLTNLTANDSGTCNVALPFPATNSPARFYRCVWP